MDDDKSVEITPPVSLEGEEPREVAGVIPFVRREERKPGDWTAELQKEAQEKLGINILKADHFPEGQNRRPTSFSGKADLVYSDEVADEICDRLLCGETLSSITQDPRMPSYSTVYRWYDKFPDFKDKVTLAKKEGTHFIADDCLRISDDLNLDPSHKRLMVDTRLRLIKSWNSRAYADNVKVSGDEGAPPVRFFIEGLSDRIKE